MGVILYSMSWEIIFQGFLFKCMGVVMRKAAQRQFVQKLLDTMFSTVKHSSQVEREVCAYYTCNVCLHLCV